MNIKDLENALSDALKSPDNSDFQQRYCDSITEYLEDNKSAVDILPIVIQGIDIDRGANYFDYLEIASNSYLKNLWKELSKNEIIEEADNVRVLKFLSGILFMSFIGAGNLGKHFGSIITLLVERINSPHKPISIKVYKPILRDYALDDLEPNTTLPKWESIKASAEKCKEFAKVILNSADGDDADKYKFIKQWARRGLRFAEEKEKKTSSEEKISQNSNIDHSKDFDPYREEKKKVNDQTMISSPNQNVDNTNADQEITETEKDTVKQKAIIVKPSKDMDNAYHSAVAHSDEIENKNALEAVETENAQSDQKVDISEEDESTTISLIDRSDLFKQIIDIALACEQLENDNKKLEASKKRLSAERKKLKEENSQLNESCEKLKEEKKIFIQRLEEAETIHRSELEKIKQLQADIAQRDEVIGIIKADKSESAQEYKNSLAASLKAFYTDYVELRELGSQDDIALALSDTLENVFKTLEGRGITIT